MGKISFDEGDIRDKEFMFSVFEKALIEKPLYKHLFISQDLNQ